MVGLRLAVVAMVADQAGTGAVISQRGIAARAAQDSTAIPAEDKSRGSPPVEEENDLLAPAQSLVHRLLERAAKDGAIAGAQLGPQIHDLHRRQRYVAGLRGAIAQVLIAGMGDVVAGLKIAQAAGVAHDAARHL